MHWWAVWLAVPIQVSAACDPRRERVTAVDGLNGVHRLDLRDGCNQSRTQRGPCRRYRDPTTPPRTNIARTGVISPCSRPAQISAARCPERHPEPRCQRGVDCLVSLSGAQRCNDAASTRTSSSRWASNAAAPECSTGMASSSSWSSARPRTTLSTKRAVSGPLPRRTDRRRAPPGPSPGAAWAHPVV